MVGRGAIVGRGARAERGVRARPRMEEQIAGRILGFELFIKTLVETVFSQEQVKKYDTEKAKGVSNIDYK